MGKQFNPEELSFKKYSQQKQFSPEELGFGSSSEKPKQDDTVLGYSKNELIKGGLETLPTIGGIAGGLIGGLGGAVTGPGAIGTAAAGAGLGGAFGKSLESLGKGYFLNEKQDSSQVAKDIATEGALSAAGEGVGRLAFKGAGLLAKSKPAQYVAEKVGEGAKKLASSLTGISEKEIGTYASKADEIKKLSEKSGGNIPEAADSLRQKFISDIESTQRAMNDKISSALSKTDKSIDATPIINSLEKAKAKIDPNLDTGGIKQIDSLIERIKGLGGGEVSGEPGLIPASKAHELKGFLQEQAKSAYRAPGQPLSLGTDAAKAAKGAAAVARKEVNKAAPEVAEANNKLSKILTIEENMNKNLIRTEKPEAGLLAAGSGGNLRNAEVLKALGKETGTDMLGEAEKLAAMRTFGNANLLPMDSTGKSVARMGLGTGLGYLVGDKEGAAAGAALSSPLFLKALIDSGRLSGKALSSEAVQNYLLPAVGQSIGKGLLRPSER